MKRKITSLTLICSILFAGFLSSCIGSFGLSKKVLTWNKSVTDNKFVNEFIFLVFLVVPVYSIASFIDIIILNSIEFWTGSNPVAMKDGESESQFIVYKGKKYEMVATKNQLVMKDLRGKEVSKLKYNESDMTWYTEQDNKIQKIASVDDIDGSVATYTIYDGICSEGQMVSINSDEFSSSLAVLK